MSSPAPREAERRAGLAAAAGFFLLSIYFTGFFPPWANPNELSRLEAVYAFVEQGTFSIDGAIPVLGNHEDKAISGGHFYSNKAPGLTFAAIPVYRTLRVFCPAPRSPWDAVFVLLRILTVSLLYTLALARFVARLPPVKGAGLLVFALTFGTPLLFCGLSTPRGGHGPPGRLGGHLRIHCGAAGRPPRMADGHAGIVEVARPLGRRRRDPSSPVALLQRGLF